MSAAAEIALYILTLMNEAIDLLHNYLNGAIAQALGTIVLHLPQLLAARI